MLSDTANSLFTDEILENDRYGSSKPMTTSRAEVLTYHFVHMQCSSHLFLVPSLYRSLRSGVYDPLSTLGKIIALGSLGS